MTPRRTWPRAAALVALGASGAVALAACGGAGAGTGGGADGGDAVAGTAVEVVDNDFEPGSLQVRVGETVTWTWAGRADHNVVGDGFGSDVQQTGTFTHTFDEPGTYDYACTLHGGMKGSVSVTE